MRRKRRSENFTTGCTCQLQGGDRGELKESGEVCFSDGHMAKEISHKEISRVEFNILSKHTWVPSHN